MFRGLIGTSGSLTLTLLRVVLGVLFFAHGAQKALGWYGGSGFDATVQFFGQNLHIPQVWAAAAILAEFLGGILLVFGFLTRLAALGIAVNMAVAVWMVHIHNGLFMNWTGTQRGEGFEYHLLAFAMAFTLIVRGGGALSLDRAIDRSISGERHDTMPLPRAA